MRVFLDQARRATGTDRSVALRAARDLLSRTDALALPDGSTYAVRDTDLIAAIDAGVDPARLLDMVDAQRLAARSNGSIDARAARDRLREITGDYAARDAGASIVDIIISLITRLLASLSLPQVDIGRIVLVIGGVGAALIVLVVAVLGRGMRERVRGEAALPPGGVVRLNTARDHLAMADAAIEARRSRDALHALYLYALTALAEREVIGYDPSLTDGELLIRTSALPQARELSELILLYERTWFGLRDAADADVARARALALRVAA